MGAIEPDRQVAAAGMAATALTLRRMPVGATAGLGLEAGRAILPGRANLTVGAVGALRARRAHRAVRTANGTGRGLLRAVLGAPGPVSAGAAGSGPAADRPSGLGLDSD